MLDALSRAERCRDLAEECRHVAALCAATEMRSHYSRMADHYRTLAEARGAGYTGLRSLAASTAGLDGDGSGAFAFPHH